MYGCVKSSVNIDYSSSPRIVSDNLLVYIEVSSFSLIYLYQLVTCGVHLGSMRLITVFMLVNLKVVADLQFQTIDFKT